MNKNRKFLMPLAALASVFLTNNASASASGIEPKLSANSTLAQNGEIATASDVFKFILRTPAQSQVMAYHSSHSSHSSHASHSSHSSHQSGYTEPEQ